MTKRMLIDASHPEETRVVVLNDHQLEDFDFESSTKKQLKGNIYLAKVTRVEPSLQAAFVDYGGQRHGFLPFSEIHPDYYQIPQADRKLLEDAGETEAEAAEPCAASDDVAGEESTVPVSTDPDEEAAEVFDEQARRRSRLLRSYKIQEVIKRRQILLVQVVKEERGNKGAALTTYLSLAGRYSVLMPNTARGGGISRKIANPADRARLKAIAKELDVPEGMGLIIRTAGQQRSKLEIRRDYEYSLRLWSDIRERTLKSIAPCMIHEEGSLVKRAIRDLYSRDIDEVLVEGEEGYRTAKKVMTMLTPSRARRVKLYKDELPLFQRYHVEEQLDGLHEPVIHLKSGASIVIHTTEALTAIDVNSGRSTRERNIEETALKTNLEAAAEIARQLRLRDIAGLVVIDFIDMAEMRNQRAVERKLREHLKSDRARVQLGRISPFGLLELSRQRLRPSFQELSTQPCPTCNGVGAIRSVESAALQALRAIEQEGLKGRAASLKVTLPLEVALYMLNQKRDRLTTLEQRYELAVQVAVDRDLIAGQYHLETLGVRPEAEVSEAPAETRVEPRVEPRVDGGAAEAAEEDGETGRKRRRRRRRRRKSVDGEAEAETIAAEPGEVADGQGLAAEPVAVTEAAHAPAPVPQDEPAPVALPEVAHVSSNGPEAPPTQAEAQDEGGAKPRRRRRRASPRRTAREDTSDAAAEKVAVENGADQPGPPRPEFAASGVEASPDAPAEKPRPEMSELSEDGPQVPPAEVVDREQPSTPRRGWWSRFVRKDES